MSKASRKLSPQDQTNRYIGLETLYGQKAAAQRLGISADSFRRYRDGKRQAPDDIYKKLNTNYNRNKSRIDPGKVQAKADAIHKRHEAQIRGKAVYRTAPIYPDYITMIKQEFSLDSDGEATLEALAERGYVASWFGYRQMPVEVQFIIWGESPKRWGEWPTGLALINKGYNPKKPGVPIDEDEDQMNMIIEEKILKETLQKYIRARKTDDFDTRMEKIADFMQQKLEQKIDKKQSITAILGYYFDEDDEV